MTGSDTERARGSLRQAPCFLLQSLRRDVIVNRGEDEIGIGSETLHCDVVAFESALDAGDAQSCARRVEPARSILAIRQCR
jgi:DNA-binding SARP family transcriptional activator